MSKKIEKIKSVENEEKPKFEITKEIMDQLLNGTLTPDDKAVSYLIEQLKIARQQYDEVYPQIQQKEKELLQLKKGLHEIAVRFQTLQIDICNLWPN